MQTTAMGTVANSLPKNEIILLTLLISDWYIPYTDLIKIPVFTEKIPGLDQQINLALRSAFTIFASDRRRFGQARTGSARRSLLLSLQKISL